MYSRIHRRSDVYYPPLRSRLSKWRQLRSTRHVQLRGRVVRPELYGAGVPANLRQWWKLHRTRSLLLPVGVVRGKLGFAGRRVSYPCVRCGVLKWGMVRCAWDVLLPTAMDRLRLRDAHMHTGWSRVIVRSVSRWRGGNRGRSGGVEVWKGGTSSIS